MRLSTIFISTAFLFANMSTALPGEREDMLLARFADSDFFAEVEARAYDKELEFYARGSTPSKLTGHNRNPIYRSASREPLLESRPNESNLPKIYRSTSREPLLESRPNTDNRPHPVTSSSDSRLSTTTRQRQIARDYARTRSPAFSLHSNSKPNAGGRRRRSFDDLD